MASVRKNICSAAIASAFAVLAFVTPAQPAFAACVFSPNYQEEGGLSGWGTRVANSQDADLRAAYAAGTCIYLKGVHGGGTVPPDAPDDLHVSVKASSQSPVCHVFKKRSNAPQDAKYPTTCF